MVTAGHASGASVERVCHGSVTILRTRCSAATVARPRIVSRSPGKSSCAPVLALRPDRMQEDEPDRLVRRSPRPGRRPRSRRRRRRRRAASVLRAPSLRPSRARRRRASRARSAGTSSCAGLHLVRVRDDRAEEDVARAGNVGQPRRRRARRCTTRRCERQSPRRRSRSSTSAGVETSLAGEEVAARAASASSRARARRRAASAPGSTNRSTWISNSRAQIVTSTPSPSPPASASAWATCDSEDAVEAQDAATRRLRTGEEPPQRRRLERTRPELLQLAWRPGQHDRDASPGRSSTTRGRGADEADAERALGQRRLLAHARLRSRRTGARAARRRAARAPRSPPQAPRRPRSSTAGCPREQLDRPVVVRRPEPAGDARAGRTPRPSAQRGLADRPGRRRRS